MARERAQAYRSTELADLARQLLYAPPDKRAEVVRQAEKWHDELDPATNVPLDFAVYRLTGRRVPPSESVMLVGEVLGPDLRLLIDTLSRSIELPADEGDPGETTAELAERLGVSTKTIARWRDRGLRWRWAVRASGDKPTVVIPRSALDAFENKRSGRVDAASRFSRMSDAEKTWLINRARRLADATQAVPQTIFNHLGKRTGRSAEALRMLIAEHDREHPSQEVFADRAGPLTEKQKRIIDRAYRRGVGVVHICKRFRKARSTIYRAIHEMRAQRMLSIKIDLIPSPIFDRPDADEVLLRPIEPAKRPRRLDRRVIDPLPQELVPAYDRPVAPDRVVRSLIVRYNYLKHRAKQVQQGIETQSVRANDLDRFDEILRHATATRGLIIAGLLPVVLSVVRRQLGGRAGDVQGLLAMLEPGNALLIDEIEKFDASRSHTLESVLTNRLLRVLARDTDRQPVDTESLIRRLEDAGWASDS